MIETTYDSLLRDLIEEIADDLEDSEYLFNTRCDRERWDCVGNVCKGVRYYCNITALYLTAMLLWLSETDLIS